MSDPQDKPTNGGHNGGPDVGPHGPKTGSDIGWAVQQLAAGLKVRRQAWDGTQLYVVQEPVQPTGASVRNYYFISTGGANVLWQIHQDDIMNDDWVTVP